MVYIELILLINLLIHILFVKNSYMLLSKKLSIKRLVISSLVDTIYMLIYCYRPAIIEGFSLFIVILIGVISFNGSKKEILLGTILYFCMNFLLGGVSEILFISLKYNTMYLLFSLIGIMLVSIIYKEFRKYTLNLNKLSFDLKIIHNNKEYYLKAYCDTGNFLTDEAFIPIIFLNKRYKIGRKAKEINCQSINVSKSLSLYSVDEFYIKINDVYIKKDVYIAYSSINFEAMIGLGLISA